MGEMNICGYCHRFPSKLLDFGLWSQSVVNKNGVSAGAKKDPIGQGQRSGQANVRTGKTGVDWRSY